MSVDREPDSLLFVCTGNIFRSVVAEYALRDFVSPSAEWQIASAGIEALPRPVALCVVELMQERGFDLSFHRPTKLTQALVDKYRLLVAISPEHQRYLKDNFGRNSYLFNEIAYGKEAAILDIDERMPDWEKRSPAEIKNCAGEVIDFIFSSIPAFYENLNLKAW